MNTQLSVNRDKPVQSELDKYKLNTNKKYIFIYRKRKYIFILKKIIYLYYNSHRSIILKKH